MSGAALRRDDPGSAVARYKAVLKTVLDARPSGTRRRLAAALGKHRSFVSQIATPTYPVPIPAQHLTTIFEICHFSAGERAAFLQAYEQAHPGRGAAAGGAPVRTLTLTLPDLGSPARNAALDRAAQEIVARLVAFAEKDE